MKNQIVIGSRGSKLAIIQAESISARLKNQYPGMQIEIKIIVTHGDRDKVTVLDKMDASVFVKELEHALLNCEIDIAVHSLKDLPVNLLSGFSLLAVPERIDPRDVLVTRSDNLDTLPVGSTIGTASLRRRIQMLKYRSDLKICDIRGNIDTRLNKIYTGEIDGLITAAAAMIRLKKEDKIIEYLSTDHFLPSAGQGALGIEARSADFKIREMISPINCLSHWKCCLAERQLLRSLGLGCRAPVAALGTATNGVLKLEAWVTDASSSKIFKECLTGSLDCAEELGVELAAKMVKNGASKAVMTD